MNRDIRKSMKYDSIEKSFELIEASFSFRSSNRPGRNFILPFKKNRYNLSPVFYSKKRNVTGPCVIIEREREREKTKQKNNQAKNQ